MADRKHVFRSKLILHKGGSLPPSRIKRLRWLGVLAPTAFGALLLAFTLAFHHTLPLWLVVLLVLGVSAAGAALFSWFVFTQIEWFWGTILSQQETLQALYRASFEIQEPLDLQERLNRLLQTAQDVLSLDRLNILLADPEKRWLQAVASLGAEEPSRSDRKGEAWRRPTSPSRWSSGMAGGQCRRSFG